MREGGSLAYSRADEIPDPQGAPVTADSARAAALALYRRSVIKQEKVRRILELLHDPADLDCLDVGGDNGVVSLLLRMQGGRWTSADLDEATVAAIRGLVGDPVHRIDGGRTPFSDHAFDQVVIVDFLEHIEADEAFARELARILKPEGTLIVNVPHHKPGSWIVKLRHAVGLTDEKHGHLRPGYRIGRLRELFDGSFTLESWRTYSRAFSELVDLLLNLAYELRSKPRDEDRSAKGTVVTTADLAKRRKELTLLSILYPFLWTAVRLDRLLVGTEGHRLIARFRRSAPAAR
ncbi:MAG: methyltransferase domain-containing protein [Candidatus Eisenbacteria bacterium]|nr:methyltransferase domain-containing protein [Candidatus Latescibacterota bacterium]MBD3301820.1 methyltransferase domain-containing protein [Candidatus Eisenbacteria bacterium]